MKQRIMEFCRKEGFLEPGSSVVAGVSGGADSVCLLRLLCDIREEQALRVTAVHIHHGIRGQEAQEDMEYVEKLCREWRVDLHCFLLDIPALAAEQKISEEEAGRNERYRILEEVRRATGSDWIAVAHHMDDLAETVLMNLLRGSGMKGVSGIRAKRDRIIRPLLCVRRREIEMWLREQGIVWRTDHTNLDNDYFRNRIRNCLIPELTKEYNEKAVEHIAGLAADLQQADAYFAEQARRLLEPVQSGKKETENGRDASLKEKISNALSEGGVCIPAGVLADAYPVVGAYLVRSSLERLGCGLKDVGRVHIESLLELAKKPGCAGFSFPGGIRADTEYGSIFLSRRKEEQKHVRFCITLRIFLRDKEKKVPQSGCINWFDYDKINGTVQLRGRRTGDVICVEAGGRRKKLKDYLIDARMPVRMRNRWPLLASGNRIIWVPGWRIGEDFRVDEGTRLILEARLSLR